MALTDTLVEIGNAIRAKDGTVEPIPFLDMPDRILAIPSGGGMGWQPPTDWWDVKTIVDTGVLEWSGASVPNVRYGYVVSDTIATTTLPAGYEYYLSDGKYYDGTSAVTHTWDRTYDKPCSEGYATRAVIVCRAADRDVAISQRALELDGIASLYVYLGDCNLTTFTFSGTSGNANANRLIRVIDHNALTTAVSFSNYTYSGCASLTQVSIPPGPTMAGNYQFMGTNVAFLRLPQSITALGSQFFYGGGSPEVIVLPGNISSFGSQALQTANIRTLIFLSTNFTSLSTSFNISGLVSISVPPGFASSIILSNSPLLSVRSMEQMIYNAALRDPQSEITFTFGATNLDKLSDEVKLFAVQNGIVLV